MKRKADSMSRILLLEDDVSLIDGLSYTLKKNGFDIDIARTIESANAYLTQNQYDLLLLDVTLPDGTGFEICERMRGNSNNVPIIFLTASDEEVNVIRGLDSGADDYITKPFKIGELLSRIHALLRRANLVEQDNKNYITSGNITIDLLGSRVMKNNVSIELTGAEYRLLCLLIRNSNQTMTRNSILDNLWDGTGNFVDDNTLSVYIRRLREKIEEDPSKPKHLLTIRGFGYQWIEVQ